LRWRDANWMERTITIRRSKTAAGERCIPLNANAWRVLLTLRDRAKSLFGDNLQSDWYVFPHCEGYSKPDPTKPMTGWRSAWRSLTHAILRAVPHNVLERLTHRLDEDLLQPGFMSPCDPSLARRQKNLLRSETSRA
jgi:integrase